MVKGNGDGGWNSPSLSFIACSFAASDAIPLGNLVGSGCMSPLAVRFGDHTPASRLMYSCTMHHMHRV
jgi:hypothetical protein